MFEKSFLFGYANFNRCCTGNGPILKAYPGMLIYTGRSL